MTTDTGFLLVFFTVLLPFVVGLYFFYYLYHHFRFKFTVTRVFDNYTDRVEAIRGSVDEGQAITARFRKGSNVAARCFYDARVAHIQMDPMLAVVFAEAIAEYVDALQWCSGSKDFSVVGHARVGWEKIVEPLIKVSE